MANLSEAWCSTQAHRLERRTESAASGPLPSRELADGVSGRPHAAPIAGAWGRSQTSLLVSNAVNKGFSSAATGPQRSPRPLQAPGVQPDQFCSAPLCQCCCNVQQCRFGTCSPHARASNCASGRLHVAPLQAPGVQPGLTFVQHCCISSGATHSSAMSGLQPLRELCLSGRLRAAPAASAWGTAKLHHVSTAETYLLRASAAELRLTDQKPANRAFQITGAATPFCCARMHLNRLTSAWSTHSLIMGSSRLGRQPVCMLTGNKYV